jgi:hypothetical protein
VGDVLWFIFVQQSAWWASAVSLYMTWQMGNQRPWAPLVGIGGQLFWLLLAIFTQQWGLIPTVFAYTFVHARNARKMRRDQTSLLLAPAGRRTDGKVRHHPGN